MSEEIVAEAPRGGDGRCRARRQRPAAPLDGLRPTDVIGAYFIVGLAMMLAGAAVAAANVFDPWTWGRWLALHLVFVGGISQLVLGASQFFAGAFLATDPPSRTLVRAQLGLWNLGAVILALAVPLQSVPGTWLAVSCLLAALTAYATGLAQMRRRSLGSAPWASRWYLGAALFLSVGTIAGAILATGAAWGHGNLLAAHMALNLGGWFGTAIVGTLHTFFPSLTQSRLWAPRLQGPTFSVWIAGIGGLALGYGFSVDGLAVAGWLLLLPAAAMLTANLAGSLLAASRSLSLAARIVAVAQVFLVVGLLVAGVEAVAAGPAEALAGATRAGVGTLLVAGWIGLTVIGSLLHLLALLVRVRDLSRGMPEPRPVRDSALAALAVAGVGWVATEQLADAGSVGGPASALLLAAYLMLGARVALLGARVVRRARPRL
jgi:nitrite reductase (NO-forming)